MTSTLDADTSVAVNPWSFSAVTQYRDCPARFRLERMDKVQRQPSWWFIGGDAFHYAADLLDLGVTCNTDEAWLLAWSRYRDAVPAGVVIQSAKPVKAGEPLEDEAWWMANGPRMVARYARWRCQQRLAGWSLLTLGEAPGVEVPFNAMFGEVPVHGVVDRVWVTRAGDIVVVDHKAGRRAPEDTSQLRIYAEGLRQQYGVDVHRAAFYMARQGELTSSFRVERPVDDLVAMFEHAAVSVSQEKFLPLVSGRCRKCPVREHCPSDSEAGTV